MARKPFEPNARQRALIAKAIKAAERTSDKEHPAPAELVRRMQQEDERFIEVQEDAEDDCATCGQSRHFGDGEGFNPESKEPPDETSLTARPMSAGSGKDALVRADTVVPADFPRSTQSGVLPGAAPKLLARLIEGRYVVGLTAQELAVRYEGCLDLVEQLQKAAGQFAARNPAWTSVELCERLRRGIKHEQHRWQLSPAEAGWVWVELGRREGWDVDDLQDRTL